MAEVKYLHVRVLPPTEDEREAAAGKTTRLRALRLAKESADRHVASPVITAKIVQRRGDRSPSES